MGRGLERDRVREFIDLIVASSGDEIDGKTLAARAFVSRFHFDRLVAAALGEAPGRFRRRLLLERAAWQLQTTRDDVTRVAMDAAYHSVDGFGRAFRQAYGLNPSSYRRTSRTFRLDAPNGVHFHPPGRITLPGTVDRSKAMDFVDRVVEHDVWFTNRLIERASELPTEALDRPTSQTWRWQSEQGEGPTLRELLNQLIANKENWVASVQGGAAPEDSGTELSEMKARYEAAGRAWLQLIREIKTRGGWDEGFVDAQCDPPQSFTYGGMLAHVMNFSAFRRTMVIFAFRELGVEDLGLGDPIEWERNLS